MTAEAASEVLEVPESQQKKVLSDLQSERNTGW
jgi:hypothetical protein